MRRLNPRQREFVMVLLETGTSNMSKATRLAGYTGTDDSIYVQASRLAHDPKVQEAIREEAGRRLNTGGIMAVSRLLSIAENTTDEKTALKAIEMVQHYLRDSVLKVDLDAREGMSVAQYVAGMAFSNVGLGIVHSMAHTLSAYYDTPHGVACALLLPYVMEFNADATGDKFKYIAEAMGVDTTGMSQEQYRKAAVDVVRELSLAVGIPQKLHEVNAKEEDIPALSADALKDACTPGNPKDVTAKDIEGIFHTAF